MKKQIIALMLALLTLTAAFYACAEGAGSSIEGSIADGAYTMTFPPVIGAWEASVSEEGALTIASETLDESGHYTVTVAAAVENGSGTLTVARRVGPVRIEAHTADLTVENGAVTYRALTSNPTISAQSWGSMLTGVVPECHRLTNSLIAERPYPADSQFPTVFRVIRGAMPDAKIGSTRKRRPGTASSAGKSANMWRAKSRLSSSCSSTTWTRPVTASATARKATSPGSPSRTV